MTHDAAIALLKELTVKLQPFIYCSNGIPATPRLTIGEAADLHTAYRKAVAALENPT